MKESFFEMLMSLFETSLAQLKKSQVEEDAEVIEGEEVAYGLSGIVCLKQPNTTSTRVFTPNEQIRLTKASYQFLMRVKSWGMVDPETFEVILHQLQFSESRIVTLEETKWTIRNTLSSSLNLEQLAFLDLLLYQKAKKQILH